MKILIIAPIGTKFTTGLGNAIKITKEILETNNYVYLVDIASGLNEVDIGKFTFNRFLFFLKIFFLILIKIPKFNIIYITLSMSLGGFFRDMIFIIISKFFFKKIFIHLHGGGYKKNFFSKRGFFLKKIITFTLNLCDKLFVLSEKFKDDFNFIDNHKKIKVLENTIKIENIKFHRDFDKLRIIYVSNFIKSKGYDLILKTCKLLADQKIDFMCEMYGKFLNIGSNKEDISANQLRKEFLDFIKHNKLENNISFSENLDPKEKYKKLRNANVFVFPSNYPGEGLPLSLLEASANKLPIISTNHGAITDIVKVGNNGFILESLNELEIMNYLIQLTKNKELFKTMSESSFKVFNESFNYKKIKEKTLNEFK